MGFWKLRVAGEGRCTVWMGLSGRGEKGTFTFTGRSCPPVRHESEAMLALLCPSHR